VGPGLIVLGAPWAALRIPRVPGLLRWPVATVLAYNICWLGWHLPVLFDLARSGGVAGIAEHVTYLGAGVLFWLQMIGSRPYRPSAPPLRRVGLLTATVIAGTLLGMVLVFGSGALYPAYSVTTGHVMSLIDDQQLAGAVLWMGSLPPMIIAAVALFQQWLSEEESAELSAGLDRLLRQRKSSWPSRPGLR